MIEDHIADGDYVVVRRQRTARKGQIVVALTDENEATLKRWYPGEEPHPPGAGQLHDEADLREGRPGAGRRRGRGAESGLEEVHHRVAAIAAFAALEVDRDIAVGADLDGMAPHR